MTSALIKIWENTDSCAEQYRCASALYLLSVFTQCFSIIIDCGVSVPGYGKEVVDGLNDIGNCYVYKLMSNLELPESKKID